MKFWSIRSIMSIRIASHFSAELHHTWIILKGKKTFKATSCYKECLCFPAICLSKKQTNIALLKSIKANANVSVSLNINCIYKYTHNELPKRPFRNANTYSVKGNKHSAAKCTVYMTVITWLMQYYRTAGLDFSETFQRFWNVTAHITDGRQQ